ncbi:MAG TPA: DNA recombination protein RmuC, partial [Thermodesulfobacteriaceae bacterium]|nr:DNA recombination protein RmuC [Thermodesulfobacteriaceae bacterium]
RNLVEVYLPRLQKETENLSRALRQPRIRGRWGEIQLKRVVEMVGMLPKCDFEEQASFSSDERTLRPDMIIRLPGGRIIAVDAKVPFEVYIEAIEEENEDEAHKKIKEYVASLKNHIKSLSQKRYWEAIESRWQKSPEFVILFLPAEGLFSAALKSDPEIVEFGAKHKVLLATPITLIAILKAVAYAWQEQELAENAREIAHLGKQLYERLRVLTEHFNDLGNRLKQAVEAYNKTVRSYESRILVTARKFEDFRMISPEKKIPELTEISTYPLENSSRKSGSSV